MNSMLIDPAADASQLLDDLDSRLELARALTGALIEHLPPEERLSNRAGELNAVYSELLLSQRLLDAINERVPRT